MRGKNISNAVRKRSIEEDMSLNWTHKDRDRERVKKRRRRRGEKEG